MTDNRTTELLRKLLEERGLSCQTHYLHTSWRVGQKLYDAVDNLDGTLIVDNLTPEQAIAATLGNSRAERTCRIEETYGNQYCTCCGEMVGTWDSESELCVSSNMVELWNYCPNCGCKVIVD